MWVGVLMACTYVHHMSACSHGRQQMASDPLKLELWIFVSHVTITRNQTRSSAGATVLLTVESALQPHPVF